MPEEAVNGIIYNSVYRHSVDDKRRVSVPFRWRPGDSTEFTLVVWRKLNSGTCIRVLPPKQWEKLMAEINAMANSDPNKPVLKRSIGSMSTQAKLDSAGRIAIPEEMAAAAGIKGQAVLVGLLDRFEIW